MKNADLSELRASLRAQSDRERGRDAPLFRGIRALLPQARRPAPRAPLHPPPRRVGLAAETTLNEAAPGPKPAFGQRQEGLEPPPLVLATPLADGADVRAGGHAAASAAPPPAGLSRAAPEPAAAAPHAPSAAELAPPPADPDPPAGRQEAPQADQPPQSPVLARLERLLAREQAALEAQLGIARAAYEIARAA